MVSVQQDQVDIHGNRFVFSLLINARVRQFDYEVGRESSVHWRGFHVVENNELEKMLLNFFHLFHPWAFQTFLPSKKI